MLNLDIFDVAFVGILIFIEILFLTAALIMTIHLFRKSKKNGRIFIFVIGLIVFLIIAITEVAFTIKLVNSPSGFGPEYDSAIIDQKIGGKLLCKSVYTADIHEWQYDVSYEYVPKQGDTIDLGYGTYYARDWKKNEQLKKNNKWLILKTGNWYGSDRVILINLHTHKKLMYDLNDEFIHRDSLWKVQKIKSLTGYFGTSYIVNISDKYIILKYKFVYDENLNDNYDERIITYKIDEESGNIKMIKIEK